MALHVIKLLLYLLTQKFLLIFPECHSKETRPEINEQIFLKQPTSRNKTCFPGPRSRGTLLFPFFSQNLNSLTLAHITYV